MPSPQSGGRLGHLSGQGLDRELLGAEPSDHRHRSPPRPSRVHEYSRVSRRGNNDRRPTLTASIPDRRRRRRVMDIVRVQHRDHHTRVNDGQRDSSRSLSNAPRGHNVGNAPDKLVELVVDPGDNDAARTVVARGLGPASRTFLAISKGSHRRPHLRAIRISSATTGDRPLTSSTPGGTPAVLRWRCSELERVRRPPQQAVRRPQRGVSVARFSRDRLRRAQQAHRGPPRMTHPCGNLHRAALLGRP